MGLTKKASSSKMKKEVPASSAAVAKPHGVSAKASKENEIDAIFGQKKRRSATNSQEILAEDDGGSGARPPIVKKKLKKTTPSVDEGGTVKVQKQSKGDRKVQKSSSSMAEPGLSKPEKKTRDGFVIYGEDELKWNNKDAGGTPLCPFDCNCCF